MTGECRGAGGRCAGLRRALHSLGSNAVVRRRGREPELCGGRAAAPAGGARARRAAGQLPRRRGRRFCRCSHIQGVRAPYLENKIELRQVAAEQGFLYDRWALRCACCGAALCGATRGGGWIAGQAEWRIVGGEQRAWRPSRRVLRAPIAAAAADVSLAWPGAPPCVCSTMIEQMRGDSYSRNFGKRIWPWDMVRSLAKPAAHAAHTACWTFLCVGHAPPARLPTRLVPPRSPRPWLTGRRRTASPSTAAGSTSQSVTPPRSGTAGCGRSPSGT